MNPNATEFTPARDIDPLDLDRLLFEAEAGQSTTRVRHDGIPPPPPRVSEAPTGLDGFGTGAGNGTDVDEAVETPGGVVVPEGESLQSVDDVIEAEVQRRLAQAEAMRKAKEDEAFRRMAEEEAKRLERSEDDLAMKRMAELVASTVKATLEAERSPRSPVATPMKPEQPPDEVIWREPCERG